MDGQADSDSVSRQANDPVSVGIAGVLSLLIRAVGCECPVLHPGASDSCFLCMCCANN